MNGGLSELAWQYLNILDTKDARAILNLSEDSSYSIFIYIALCFNFENLLDRSLADTSGVTCFDGREFSFCSICLYTQKAVQNGPP